MTSLFGTLLNVAAMGFTAAVSGGGIAHHVTGALQSISDGLKLLDPEALASNLSRDSNGPGPATPVSKNIAASSTPLNSSNKTNGVG